VRAQKNKRRLPKTMNSSGKLTEKGDIYKIAFNDQSDEADFIVERIRHLVGTRWPEKKDRSRGLAYVEGALKYRATAVIIAHDHPGGLAQPSDNDQVMTRKIKEALQTVNIDLQEHVIVAPNDFYSFRQNGELD
jgi:hypothetical protein